MTNARPIALLIGLALLLVAPSLTAAAPQDEVSPEPEPETKEEKKDKDKDKDDEDDELEVGGRVHVGFDAEHYHNESSEWADTFHIRRARLKVTWKPEDWLTARVQLDAAEAFEAGFSMVKDAWLRLSPFEQLQLRAGIFKKPFSGLEATSSGDLKVIDRGVANELVIDSEHGGLCFGDRDIGLELGGRLVESIKLDYAVGVFNGSGLALEDVDDAKDVAARVSVRPFKPLTFGVSGTIKFYDESMNRIGYPRLAVGGGADIGLKIAGFRAHLEGLIAHNNERLTSPIVPNPDMSDVDLAAGALGILSYKFKIPSEVRLALEPVVKVEYFDPNNYIIDDHVMLYTVGFNTYVGEYFRVMLDFEIMRAERNWDDDEVDQSLEVADHQERLLLLLCVDI